MKRIVKYEEIEYGKVVSVSYNIEEYSRNISMGIVCVCIPILWIFLIKYNLFKKKWRTIYFFDTLEQAKYFMSDKEINSERKTVVR